MQLFFEWKHENATCNKQQYLKYIDKVGSLLYRKKQLKLKQDFSAIKRLL